MWMLELVTTVALAAIIGYEREYRGRDAGLRTYVLIGLGSCLMMQITMHLSSLYPDRLLDITRMAAAVVTGLGFIGAGAIWKFGNSVRGLTTAAGLWVVGGIGIAVGAGFWQGAVFVTGLALLSLFLLAPVKRRLVQQRRRRRRHARS